MESRKTVIKVKLIYIKNNKTKYIQDFENDLINRMRSLIDITMIPISHKKKFSSNDELIKYEGELISKELKDNCIFYCFDKKGSKFSSEEFSELIFSQNQIINFIIGGAYGICEKIKMKASKIISFSDMEFSHEIFRLMALEQIYRAKCIYTNHPYHQN
ncbi:MAG: 23S rRNA (pseudouridine(1915)-N(3))-methyltransferase RlmH [Gammaproteobacteria bacterium]|nr:23S rRNA (pseudouridine(1915)-N(3))-methyltransferase RlmH [Gammaproteobacteria bacterium]|tara:strand:- start:188 stop:664 length:477 start_codon:yes stop_codon:yes gene_type:complete